MTSENEIKMGLKSFQTSVARTRAIWSSVSSDRTRMVGGWQHRSMGGPGSELEVAMMRARRSRLRLSVPCDSGVGR